MGQQLIFLFYFDFNYGQQQNMFETDENDKGE